MQRIGFYLFSTVEKLLLLLPHSWRKAFFIFLGNMAYKLDKKHRKVVEQNLRFVYGETLSNEFIKEIQINSFRQLALNLLDTIEIHHYSPEEIIKNISFENEKVVKKAQEEKRPVIFVTAHYGSWEIGGGATSYKIMPTTAVYKKARNSYFNQYIVDARSKWNMNLVESRGASKAIIKTLKTGGAVALLIDANFKKRDSIPVEFLGHQVGHVQTAAYFARKFNAAIIPALIHTEDHEHFTIKYYDEIITPKTENEAEDLRISTQRQAAWLSEEILKDPKPWFWLHRRFKTDYPEVYKD